jgi:hypothetical protein
MRLKITFFCFYALLVLALLLSFQGSFLVGVSFVVSAVLLTAITYFHVFEEKDFSPFISAYIVFTFLFFVVAPMIQINSYTTDDNPRFMTNFPYREGLTIYVNILISVFHIVFFSFYLFFKKLKGAKKVPTMKPSYEQRLPLIIVLVALLTSIIFVLSYGFVREELARPTWMEITTQTSLFLIWKKVFFLVPLGGIVLCVQYFKKRRKKAVNWVVVAGIFLFLIVLLLWFKNPLVEKRNALGPIYLSLIYLFTPRFVNSNLKVLSFLFFAMIIVFPLSAVFTHSDATLQEILRDPSILWDENKGGGIVEAFTTLNYDAFANFSSTIDYVQERGLSWGYQLLSALLFFIPRSIWTDKPVATGQEIGNYLISDYGYHYNNLSNPYISEAYVNFGWVGIILFAVILAYVFVRMIAWLKSTDLLKKIMAFYLAMHLIFMLRGDFTSSYSYFIGTIVGVMVIPFLIHFMIKHVFLYTKTWKKSKTYSVPDSSI